MPENIASKSVPRDVAWIRESRCLNCGANMNALGTGYRDVEAKPKPVDIIVCIHCGAVMPLDEELRLRGMTEAEMDELAGNHEWMDHVARMVRKIHFLRHGKG